MKVMKKYKLIETKLYEAFESINLVHLVTALDQKTEIKDATKDYSIENRKILIQNVT